MAALGSVVVELSANLAKFQSDMGKAAQIAQDRMQQIDKAVGLMKASLGALGLGFALGATIDKVKDKIESAIASAAGLQQLSERTGAAVASLSGLASVAKLSGTDMESLAGGLQKLSKAIVDAQNGGAKTSAAFQAIGIAVDSLKGKGPDQVFKQMAERLNNYQDGVEKTVITQTLLGKTGANLLPVMKDLAEVGDLQVKVTQAQAEAADTLEKNQVRLKVSTDALFKKIGLELVPILNAFVLALLESQNANDGVRKSLDDLAKDGSIRDWAEGAAQVVGLVVDAFEAVSRVVQITGKWLGALAAQAAFFGQGQWREGLAVGTFLKEDVDAIMAKQMFSTRLAQQLAQARQSGTEPGLARKPKDRIDVSKLGNANEGPADDPRKKLLEGQLKAQEDFIAAEKTLLQTREQYIDFYRNLDYLSLREAEQLKQDLIGQNLRQVKAAYDQELAAIQAYIDQADKEVERQDGRNKLAEVQKRRLVAETESGKQIGDSQNRLLAVQRQFDLATQERSRSDAQANEQALFQISLLGQSTLQVEKLTAAKKIQSDLDERIYRLTRLDPQADTSAAVAQAALQTAAASSLIELAYQRQRDAIFGASQALRNYQEAATNTGLQVENALTRALQGMEDALVNFVMTAKLSFSGLANAIVADITRIIIKQQISNAMGVAGSGGGGLDWLNKGLALVGLSANMSSSAGASSSIIDPGLIGPRALGGPVSAGQMYQVNERGPELLNVAGKQYLMMGANDGAVTPNQALGGGHTVHLTVNQSFAANTSRATTLQAAAEASRQLQYAARNL